MRKLMADIRVQDALLAAWLALLVFLQGAHTLERFWLGDDTPILAHMLKHSLLEIFFEPTVWQELSTANLTPWISLSFYVDYALAGLNPGLFYLHHLLALWLVGVVAARLLMLFVERPLAWSGAVLFLLGAPVLRVGDQLFTRHYLEGLLLCLLALLFFFHHQRSGKRRFQLLALLCYALAMTAKEIYVPLAVLLVFLSPGNWTQRMREARPYLIALMLYVAWRGYMLSGHAGGYAQGSAYMNLTFWTAVATSFAGIPALLFGAHSVFIALALLAVLVAGFVRWPRRLPLGLLVAGLVLAPLVPLVAYPGITSADRYLLLPWFALCFGIVVQAQVVRDCIPRCGVLAWPRIAAVSGCLVFAVAIFQYRSLIQQSEAHYYRAVDVQMRHVWSHDASTAFLPDAAIAPSFGMVRALGEVKRLTDPSASIPKAALDLSALDPTLPLYAYSVDCACMHDISTTIPQRLAQIHHQQRRAPLTLALSNHDGWIAWDFGPYETGSYSVVSDYIGNLPLPARQAGLRTNIRRDLEFYVRYTAPEGWVTYSPPLRLKPDGEQLTWRRD
jgi:hypothetical protein